MSWWNTFKTNDLYHTYISIETGSLPNDKILDSSKMKAFADDKVNVTQK